MNRQANKVDSFYGIYDLLFKLGIKDHNTTYQQIVDFLARMK